MFLCSVHRFLCGRIVQFLTNMHATHQTIYLTRHGQSEYNYQGKIGGDSGLSLMGEKFAVALAKYCVDTLTKDPETNAPRPCRLYRPRRMILRYEISSRCNTTCGPNGAASYRQLLCGRVQTARLQPSAVV